jgi:hypothetical protein
MRWELLRLSPFLASRGSSPASAVGGRKMSGPAAQIADNVLMVGASLFDFDAMITARSPVNPSPGMGRDIAWNQKARGHRDG